MYVRQPLHLKQFLTEDNAVNIMMVKDTEEHFFAEIPELDSAVRDRFADMALAYGMNAARPSCIIPLTYS